VSLLLDALRRAGTARGGDIAEPIDRRPVVNADAVERNGADEFDLDIEAATAAQTPQASGGSLSGPARAEAVFRGGASGGTVIRTAALYGLGALVLLGGLLLGGWYYYESTRGAVDRELVRYSPDPEPVTDRATGSDTAADGAAALDPDAVDVATGGGESGDTAASNGSASEGSGSDATDPPVDAAAALASAPQGEAADDSPDPAPDAGNTSMTDGAATGDAGTAASGIGSAGDETASVGAEGNAGAAASSNAATGPSATQSAASPDSGTSSKDVRAQPDPGDAPMVRRTGSGDGRSPLAEALQEGYRALRSGDLMRARRHYREAVELDPSNRDARLGAAAVAQRQGNAAAAIEHYRRVLSDHPRDPYARSGLASLESTGDPRQIESELKTLLKQDPDAHALRYALGNLYARENRWSQAQSAYFEAFRAAPGEADYAFNLAVALDQLGQRESAATYYAEALELAGDGSASFPLESARGRLESLSQ